MTCTRIPNGFICGPDKFVDMAPFGAGVWMEWHHYLGPTFYRSKSMIEPINNPSAKTWAAFAKWQLQQAKEEWHRAYMDRIKEKTACDEGFAKATLDAGMDDFDYSDDPKNAADEELSYWSE